MGLRQLLGATVATALERRLEERVFLLGALDREIDKIPGGVLKEMGRLLALLQSAAMPDKAIDSSPIYTADGLELALRDAVESFLRPWEARLGLTYRDGIRIEHWTRPKALSRRVANGWNDDEYDTLKPKADLLTSLQEEISRWLDSPAGWTREPRDEEERSGALNSVRSGVFNALQNFVGDRLAVQYRRDWMSAYTYSGSGSSSRRASEIRRIFEESAPPISSAMKPQGRAFLTEVVEIVRSAVRMSGGQFDSPPIPAVQQAAEGLGNASA